MNVLSQTLSSIISQCLTEAERLKMKSLSFPAIGTGVLNFPRDVVARLLLREVQTFSRKKTPQHLAEVFIVVHPNDSSTERVSEELPQTGYTGTET